MFNAIRIRAASQLRLASVSNRHLSMACNQSLEKLNGILEEYRASHYSQELPRRFRKDIVKAATKRSATTGFVSAEGIESVLSNIGAEDQMSRSEIELMLREVSGDQDRCAISVEEMLNLLSPRSVA